MLKQIVIISCFLNSLALIHIEAAELSAEHRMPEPIALQFISRMAPGYEHGQTENEQTELFRDLATSNDANNLCTRIALDLQNNPISAVVDYSARYAGTLLARLSEIVTDGFPERAISNGYWLTPFMIAVLRGNRELLNCIISNKTHQSTHFNKELMFANQLALGGHTYPLARLLQRRRDLVEAYTGLEQLFDTRQAGNDKFIVRYWLGGLTNEPQQLHAHPLLMQFQLSERSVKNMLQRLIYSTGWRLNMAWSYPEALPLIPRVLQEIRSRLQSEDQLTLGNIASVVFAPEFKQWLEQFIRRGYIPQQEPPEIQSMDELFMGTIDSQPASHPHPLYLDPHAMPTISATETLALLQRFRFGLANRAESLRERNQAPDYVTRQSTAVFTPQSEGPLTATQLVDATGTGRFYAQSTVQDLQQHDMRDPETRELLAPVAVTNLTQYLKTILWQRRTSRLVRQSMSKQEQAIAIAQQPIAIEDIPAIDAVTHEAIILSADQARTLIAEIVSHDPRLASLDERTRIDLIDQLLAQSAVGTEHNLHDLEKLQNDIYPAMVRSISLTEQEETHA